MSLEMARIAVADGITTTAGTPHIYPGLYENRRDDIHDIDPTRITPPPGLADNTTHPPEGPSGLVSRIRLLWQ